MSVFTVVTCMGRLGHLRESLPTFPRPTVLVDYSCPDKCGKWAEESCLRTTVVSVPGQVHFHKAKALNAGAASASAAGAEWLVFLDADTVVTASFEDWLSERTRRDGFSVAAAGRESESLMGVLVVRHADFVRAGGFDEGYSGWGVEDVDMRLRLRLLAGCRSDRIPDGLLVPLRHEDSLRTRHYPMKNRWISRAVDARRLEAGIREWTGRGPSELDEETKGLMRA